MVIEIGYHKEIKFPKLSAEQLVGIFEVIAQPVLEGLVDEVEIFSGEWQELTDGTVSVHAHVGSLFSVKGKDLLKAMSIFAANHGSNLKEGNNPKRFKRKREDREVIVREWRHPTDKPRLFLVRSQESPIDNPENFDGRTAFSLKRIKKLPKKT